MPHWTELWEKGKNGGFLRLFRPTTKTQERYCRCETGGTGIRSGKVSLQRNEKMGRKNKHEGSGRTWVEKQNKLRGQNVRCCEKKAD